MDNFTGIFALITGTLLACEEQQQLINHNALLLLAKKPSPWPTRITARICVTYFFYMSDLTSVYALVAPLGQLSGNGQLRETVEERRKRYGGDASFWYLSPSLVERFNLSGTGMEGVIAEDLTAINWLQLRFGGESFPIQIDRQELKECANELPPAPIVRDISG